MQGLFTKPVVLASGLNKTNVTRGIKTLRPAAVDGSGGGGVETDGIKDAIKIREFVSAARKGSEAIGQEYSC